MRGYKCPPYGVQVAAGATARDCLDPVAGLWGTRASFRGIAGDLRGKVEKQESPSLFPIPNSATNYGAMTEKRPIDFSSTLCIIMAVQIRFARFSGVEILPFKISPKKGLTLGQASELLGIRRAILRIPVDRGQGRCSAFAADTGGSCCLTLRQSPHHSLSQVPHLAFPAIVRLQSLSGMLDGIHRGSKPRERLGRPLLMRVSGVPGVTVAGAHSCFRRLARGAETRL